MVGHMTKSQKARKISKNGILFVIFPFETNLNFSRSLSILGCLQVGDLDKASFSKW